MNVSLSMEFNSLAGRFDVYLVKGDDLLWVCTESIEASASWNEEQVQGVVEGYKRRGWCPHLMLIRARNLNHRINKNMKFQLQLLATLSPLVFAQSESDSSSGVSGSLSSGYSSEYSTSDQESATVWVSDQSPLETGEVYEWSANWNPDIQIHQSCNRTQYAQLMSAWEETKELSEHARDHTSRFGNQSYIYRKYFGDAATAEVIGWFDNIVHQDKTTVLFRCDNPDGNCANEGWAGHWRGSNGSDETVICDLSYQTRRSLKQLCSLGYDVSTGQNAVFWSADFLHRLWHTDTVGQSSVDHYADTYDECLELANESPEEAVRNSASLRLYALEVYAYDITLPGQGCSGDSDDEDEPLIGSEDSEDNTQSTSTSEEQLATEAVSEGASSSATSDIAESTTSEEEDEHDHSHTETDSETNAEATASATSSETASLRCHTHEGGETHCV